MALLSECCPLPLRVLLTFNESVVQISMRVLHAILFIASLFCLFSQPTFPSIVFGWGGINFPGRFYVLHHNLLLPAWSKIYDFTCTSVTITTTISVGTKYINIYDYHGKPVVQHTILYLYITVILRVVWWWKWREVDVGDGTVSDCCILLSSSYHHIVTISSSHCPHIFFFPPLHVPCSIFISPLYRIRCGLWWNGNGRRWEMEGWVMAAFEQLARQHQDGMGWDGTDLPQKEIFFPACASNDMHLPVWWVAWIQPESRLRLVPGSAVLFPFHIYFGKASSFPGLVAD